MVSEVEKRINKCIDDKKSFILEAGAGSGKTWTLIHTIIGVLERNEALYKIKNKSVECIKYTKFAREEVIERISSDTKNQLVVVNTIHEFLWNNIKQFNKEIKEELIEYIKEKIEKNKNVLVKSKPTTKKYKAAEINVEKYTNDLNELNNFDGKITYRNIPNWRNGIISHDEVLYISNKLFKKYKVIRKILQDSYPIILVDEYQDTSPLVADILLEELLKKTSIILGFFGDSMQQIYNDSIGKIDSEKYGLELITKEENYRSSTEVIDILNTIRTDEVKQFIPNNVEKHGKCLFYYINDLNFDVEKFISTEIYKDLKLSGSEKIKRLYLTTASIARKNNYIKLHDLYVKTPERNKDEILRNKDNRSCKFANYLYDIEGIVELYETERIQELLSQIPFELKSFQDKVKLSNYLKDISQNRCKWTIGEVFKFINEKGILPMKSELLMYYGYDETFTKDDFFLQLTSLSYEEFKNLYYTIKEDSLYTTEHGTKGDEYENVVCIVNDNDWRNYNLNSLFENIEKENINDVQMRTKKLFYVVCSRAKYNLAIVKLSQLSDLSINNIKQVFGEENFINIYEKSNR